jgi:hypothetical protein
MLIDGIPHDVESHRIRFRLTREKMIVIAALVILATVLAFGFGIVHATGPFTPASMGGAEHPHYI